MAGRRLVRVGIPEHVQASPSQARQGRSDRLACIAAVPSGLEEAAAAELAALGAQAVRPCAGLWPWRPIWPAFTGCTCRPACRFGSCVNWPASPAAPARTSTPRVQAAADWQRWLPPEARFRVDSTGTAPGLNHSHYSALEAEERPRGLAAPAAGASAPRWIWRIPTWPSISTSVARGPPSASMARGGSLHRRGHRAAMGLAPLKENLAAGSRWPSPAGTVRFPWPIPSAAPAPC
jgi:putative N6-adenine-specific DNA methylase